MGTSAVAAIMLREQNCSKSKWGNCMKKTLLITLFAILAGTASAGAQQRYAAVDRVPEGRRVAGWLVDDLTFQYRADIQSSRLQQSFGARGVSSVSAGPGNLTYSAAPNSNTAQYGRAFLKVDRSGPLTFVLTGNINDSTVPFTSCDVFVRLSGQDIMRGQISSRGPGGRERGGPLVGNVSLDPGYYRLEYVIGCPYVVRANYTIAIRGETDANPRSFVQGELFHVMP
jgi:hypothetical protein